MRALITGGKGFVGQWLAAHLKDGGDDVAVIDIETDVADGDAVRRVMADSGLAAETVQNSPLAGRASPPRQSAPKRYRTPPSRVPRSIRPKAPALGHTELPWRTVAHDYDAKLKPRLCATAPRPRPGTARA